MSKFKQLIKRFRKIELRIEYHIDWISCDSSLILTRNIERNIKEKLPFLQNYSLDKYRRPRHESISRNLGRAMVHSANLVSLAKVRNNNNIRLAKRKTHNFSRKPATNYVKRSGNYESFSSPLWRKASEIREGRGRRRRRRRRGRKRKTKEWKKKKKERKLRDDNYRPWLGHYELSMHELRLRFYREEKWILTDESTELWIFSIWNRDISFPEIRMFRRVMKVEGEFDG